MRKKNLFKVLFTVLSLFAFIIFTNGQELRFGIKAGMNNSTITGFDNLMNKAIGEIENEFPELFETFGIDMKFSTSYKTGFHVGGVAQYNINSFFIQPELLFTTVGAIYKVKILGLAETMDANLNYIQLPVYAGYKITETSNLSCVLGAGPYIAYGVYASEDMFSDNAALKMKRFDAGLAFMIGVEFKKAQITAGYDLGLVDIMDMDGWKRVKDENSLSPIRNGNIKISVACFF